MPRSDLLPVFALCVAMALAACGSHRGITDAVDVEDSIVRISGTACLKPILATGFVVDEGTIVTVAHGIAGVEDDLRVVDASGSRHRVEVVAFDDKLDIAVMSVAGYAGTPIQSAGAKPQDTGVIGAMSTDSTIDLIDYEVLRIVNARSGDIYDEGHVERAAIDVRTDAKRGTSGAPLLDGDGEYIGMVIAVSRDRDDGVYALAAFEIVEFLASSPVSPGTEIGRCR